MAAYKKIQGNSIKPTGGKPANFSNPTSLRGTVKSVSNLKGGNMLVGHSFNGKFHAFEKPKINSGAANQIHEARGKHLA